MTVDEKFARISEVGEEITTVEELKVLLNSDQELVAYDGFEPSGRIHLPQGLLRAININKMIDAGVTFKMLVADWHAWANHKIGGDLGKIQKVGEYFIEVWKASGLDTSKVEFVWASDLVKKEGYWDLVMKIAVKTNLARVLRTTQIMGRSESDTLTASQIMYPLMQTADIFMLGAHITQLGMDQRKINMLAREIAKELGYTKPIIVSHHMLLGLTPPENIAGKESDADESATDRAIRLKMSKSKPDSAIFMTDSREDIERKIQKAWAPEGITVENPLLEYCKYVIFAKENVMNISRLKKFGGDVSYESYAQLETDYADKKLFPLDLKSAVIDYLDSYLEPVRKHFEENDEARGLKEEVESFEVTR